MIEHYIRGFEEELREIRHQIHETGAGITRI